jgi:microcin C transport system permease protein
MNRFAYLVRRLLLVIPTFLGITLVCFALTRLLPGGPVDIQLMKMRNIGGMEGKGNTATLRVTDEYREELKKQFGFDQPLAVQYWDWLVNKRMGLKIYSYDYPNRTAWDLIASRIPVSLWFGVIGFLLSYLVCIPLGIAKALRHRQRFDAFSSLVVFAGYAIPSFALGMVLKMFFSGTVEQFWDLFPLGGYQSDLAETLPFGAWLADRAWHLALPVTCYVAVMVRKWGTVFFIPSLIYSICCWRNARWATPKRCCSSTIIKARFLKRISFWIKEWVPIIRFILPFFKSSKISFLPFFVP